MLTICMVVLCIGASEDFMADPEANARVGDELRRIREQASLSGSAVARELGWSQSKVSRVETGRFGASIGEVAALWTTTGSQKKSEPRSSAGWHGTTAPGETGWSGPVDHVGASPRSEPLRLA